MKPTIRDVRRYLPNGAAEQYTNAFVNMFT